MEIKKFNYLKNEKSFLDEIKNIFNSVWRSIIWWKVKICYKIADASFSTNPTKCSNSVFDHFVGLALKGLNTWQVSKYTSLNFLSI